MRFLRRKRSDDEVEERCPHCNEPVPDEATHCNMCGVDLRPFRGTAGSAALESPRAVSKPRG
jgi:predicted amidophosphoribosyltransferase